MATDHNHYAFNPQLPSGARLRSGLEQLEQGKAVLTDELATMTADLTGDGTSVTHFTNVTARYGFGSNDYSQAAWQELNSALAKINSDASQTNVNSALDQLFTRLR